MIIIQKMGLQCLRMIIVRVTFAETFKLSEQQKISTHHPLNMHCINCKLNIARFAACCAAVGTFIIAYGQTPRLVTLPASPARGANRAVVEAYLAETVDVLPTFPGGDTAMMRYINDERRYPREAYDANIQGRVVCGFIVAPDGSISNVNVVRGVESSLNQEAVRLISSMPAWQPGELNGQKVSVYCLLPIPFRR